MFVACGGLRPKLICALSLFTGLAAFAISGPVRADDILEVTGHQALVVEMDHARLVKVPEKTATLVVGNPLIADVAVQPGGVMVVTAKSYGTTNLIALDRAGKMLIEHSVRVIGPVENVVLYRGIDRESYSCLPDCERRIMLGDSQNYFTSNLTQGVTLNAQAQGNAAK